MELAIFPKLLSTILIAGSIATVVSPAKAASISDAVDFGQETKIIAQRYIPSGPRDNSDHSYNRERDYRGYGPREFDSGYRRLPVAPPPVPPPYFGRGYGESDYRRYDSREFGNDHRRLPVAPSPIPPPYFRH
ncbi:MAG: hypothetical protein AAF151_16095 [Cyanobacteria bacterium J06656_5]